jgi:hypothetical protein
MRLPPNPIICKILLRFKATSENINLALKVVTGQ